MRSVACVVEAARGRQIALLGELAHGRLTSARMGELLKGLAGLEDADSVDGAMVRRARRQWERASRVPAALVCARGLGMGRGLVLGVRAGLVDGSGLVGGFGGR